MSGRPYIKFFTSDWLGDVKLQACSLAARGLWIDLICIMAEAKPYGHLLIDGKPPSYYRISQLVHSDLRVVKNLIAELKNAGVFTGDITSEITSRRMVRDEEKRQTARELSKIRWDNTPNLPYAPYSRKKERGWPSRKRRQATKQGFREVRQNWENDLRKQLGPDAYAAALDVLAVNPALVTRATKAEWREPGSGVMAAMLGLRQLNGGTP